jgi:hypothetical protein
MGSFDANKPPSKISCLGTFNIELVFLMQDEVFIFKILLYNMYLATFSLPIMVIIYMFKFKLLGSSPEV